MRNAVIVLFCACLLLCVSAPGAAAQWQEDGAGVCTNALGQEEVHAAADGEGGAFIVWRDARTGNYDIYAQRIDALGNALWTADGVGVCTEAALQYEPKVMADGNGGCIIAWYDFRDSEIDIYAQRLNAAGSAQWTTNGVLVCGATSTQDHVQLATDGAGGAFLVWEDERFYGTNGVDIYAQHLNSSGVAQWIADGAAVCTAANNQTLPQIVSDGHGGVWICWMDYRTGSNLDIYVNQITATSYIMWGSSGLAVCNESGSQYEPQIINDGYGGFYTAWYDHRGADNDIYLQGLKNDYSYRFTSNGIAVCSATGNQGLQGLVPDGAGGVIVAWRDYRYNDYDIFAQRMSGSGSAVWTANGVALCTVSDIQNDPRIVSDGTGGAIVSWNDQRNGDADIYCQKVDGSGAVQWTTDGLAVCEAFGEQIDAWPVTDGAGGVIIVWKDERANTLYDIYAQRIERNGYWGYPAPAIYAVRDVPGDQGGSVNLAWDASRIDPWPELAIDSYSLWRAIAPVQAVSMIKNGAVLLSSIGDYTPGMTGHIYRAQQLNGTTYYWELVTTRDANGYEQYSAAMPTLFDSTAVSTEQHYFQVCAHGIHAGEAWTSQPDSGYSVDNLPPAAPTSFAGGASYSPNGLTLTWDPNTEPDLAYYAVYIGKSAGFTPEPSNRVALTSDTTAFDNQWSLGAGYYYKISAFDIHGNESLWTLLEPDDVTGAGEVPLTTFLDQSYPNPFAASVRIPFGVSEPGAATLRIYDVAGRLVRTLASGTHEARRYEAAWDGRDENGRMVASGIYFYRLRAGSFDETRKMVLVR